MRRRAVFLDVDGTYADHGEAPRAHEDAVRAARANGHLVFLCTGRPASMLPERLLGVGFDGVVAGAGSWVRVGDEVLVDRRFPADLAARVVAVLDRLDVAYLLEAPEAMHGKPGVAERLTRVLAGRLSPEGHDGPTDILAALRTHEDLSGLTFGKVVYFDSPVGAQEVRAAIGPGCGLLPSSIPGMGDSAGEIFLEDVHKAVGMAEVVRHLGLSREDVVAVGDGPNDVEMLEYADVAVAVDGATEALLAVADRTVPGPREAGLVGLFEDLGLV